MARQEEDRPNEAADGIRGNSTTNGDKRGAANGPEEVKKKPNRLAAVIAKLGLDAPTLITMFK